MTDEITRLTERCEAYKGQVEAGAVRIEAAEGLAEDFVGLVAEGDARERALKERVAEMEGERDALRRQREQAFENASKWAVERGEAIARAESAEARLRDIGK
jgi:chromosome segregation ATPase